ncbi:MAG: hypothetical protein ABJH05_01835 [Fulvivirga sp.]
MHIEDQAIIATSYIARLGDEKNKCFLSKSTLFIRYRGRLERYELSAIKDIQFKHKLLLFPMIAGGVVAPLSALALLNDYGNPWALLTMLVIGLLTLYYGYEGSPTITITTAVKDYDYFISRPTPNLFAFAKYARQLYKFDDKGRVFYFSLSKEQKEQLTNQGQIYFNEPTDLLYFEETQRHNELLYAIDPVTIPQNFKLVKRDHLMVPILEGLVSQEDIITPDS